MEIEVKLCMPTVDVDDFDKFWAIARESDVKTYREIGSYIDLMTLVNGITFKWYGPVIFRKLVAERKIHGLKRCYYEERLPDGTFVCKYWLYSTLRKDIEKADFNHYKKAILHMKRKKGEGWRKVYYLENWIRHRNAIKMKKARKLREEARRSFVEKLEMHGFISGRIETNLMNLCHRRITHRRYIYSVPII